MNRRQLIGGILAASIAPAFAHAGILMPIRTMRIRYARLLYRKGDEELAGGRIRFDQLRRGDLFQLYEPCGKLVVIDPNHHLNKYGWMWADSDPLPDGEIFVSIPPRFFVTTNGALT